VDARVSPAEQRDSEGRLLVPRDPAALGTSVAARSVVVQPVAVLTRAFPARPSSIPEIRDFVRENLVDAPLDPEANLELQQSVARALLDAASPEGSVQISFRVFPDQVEVEILRPVGAGDQPPAEWTADASFAEWMAALLKREGLTQEAAARHLGVSVKTVSRWVRGLTRPRMRHLRRLVEVFGDVPPGDLS
jgi:DNA-binding XRE family transcriptional regulator